MNVFTIIFPMLTFHLLVDARCVRLSCTGPKALLGPRSFWPRGGIERSGSSRIEKDSFRAPFIDCPGLFPSSPCRALCSCGRMAHRRHGPSLHQAHPWSPTTVWNTCAVMLALVAGKLYSLQRFLGCGSGCQRIGRPRRGGELERG